MHSFLFTLQPSLDSIYSELKFIPERIQTTEGGFSFLVPEIGNDKFNHTEVLKNKIIAEQRIIGGNSTENESSPDPNFGSESDVDTDSGTSDFDTDLSVSGDDTDSAEDAGNYTHSYLEL